MGKVRDYSWIDWINKPGAYNIRTTEIISGSGSTEPDELHGVMKTRMPLPSIETMKRYERDGFFDIADYAAQHLPAPGTLSEDKFIFDAFTDTVTREEKLKELKAMFVSDPNWVEAKMPIDFAIRVYHAQQRSLLVQRIDSVALPSYAHPGDAGIDLYAAETVTLEPLTRMPVRLGVRVSIPEKKVGLLVPKSGRARKEGLSQVNSPGIIDSGYRGELVFLAYNTSSEFPIVIKRGEKCCQLVLMDAPQIPIIEVDTLDDDTQRGTGGFGSTGL